MNKLLILLTILLIGCENQSFTRLQFPDKLNEGIVAELNIPVPLQADKFNFPIGPPDGKGYYNAQKFGRNNHLGDDWNGLKGGNSDLGDPVYAIANGYVNTAVDYRGGWGNVIRITHYLPNGSTLESLYAHCDTVMVKEKTWVEIGDQIGTIGTAHGIYPAHLHLEIRDDADMPLGYGYDENNEGFLDPTEFIKNHR
ncbi:MAG: M23 family metallopeptidase [Crocinitomicaceae bacterium]|nr:M23 family metallopeptidase [Crocinitomicaceae bacterium]